MAAEKREQDAPLAERLFAEFHKFSFYQAVTLLEALAPGRLPLGTALSPADEPLRFKVMPGAAFPPSDIMNLTAGDPEHPAEMEVSFLGLIGPSGVLPNWYNELAAERLTRKDPAMVAFFNIFHHRLLSLFYLAWKKHHISVTFREGAQDRFSLCLMSLIGLGTGGLAGRMGLAEESLLFSSGLLSRQPPSAIALETVAASCSGQKAELQQFIERVVPLPPEERTRLGTANSVLGATALCGSRVAECQTGFRLCLGPMKRADFFRFLPGGELLKPTFSLIRYLAGIEYEVELRIILRREDVPPLHLGGRPGSESPRLGCSTWIKAPGVLHDRDPYVSFRESDVGPDAATLAAA